MKARRGPPAEPAAEVQHRGVAELGEDLGQGRPVERREEQVLDELGGQPPPAAVAHHDVRVVAQRQSGTTRR